MAQVSVSTSAVRLDSDPPRPSQVAINNKGTASIYLGTDNTVTTGNGYEVGAGEKLTLDLFETAAQVWAIAGSAQTVHTLQLRGRA